MSLPDYMRPGFVFMQPCRYCGKRIEWTRETGPPPDFFCSDGCRSASREATVKQLRESFMADLLRFLNEHEAKIEFEAYNDGSAGAEFTVAGAVVFTAVGSL